MVEMAETASILHQATDRSLVTLMRLAEEHRLRWYLYRLGSFAEFLLKPMANVLKPFCNALL